MLLKLRTRGHGRRVEQLVAGFSRTGEHAACWLALAAGGTLLDRNGARRLRWRRGGQAVAAAYGINSALKLVLRRPRPQLQGLPPLTGVVSGLSLPSAHATTSFAAARMFSGLAPRWLLYGVAVAFSLSRPYLGVHYPSDVLAGSLLGSAIAGLWPAPKQFGGPG